MDAIDRALERQKPLQEPAELLNQTWSEFEKDIKGKKLFLFGSGVCTDLFWVRYGECVKVEGFIDNDKKKQGTFVEDYQSEAFEKSGQLKISSIDLLKEYSPDEVVVLIGSSNYYKEIYSQLKQMGAFTIYILLFMEANERKSQRSNPYKNYDAYEQKEQFARECALRPIESKKIIVNDSYGGHQKPIIEQLLKMRNDLDIVWVTRDLSGKQPEGVRSIRFDNWKKYTYELETAKVWIWDLCVPEYIQKRDEQKFIQTKHWASITLKRFALEDDVLIQNKKLLSEFVYNSKLMDYIIVGSTFDEESCIRGFDFHKDFIWAGSPRSDMLFHQEENRREVYSYYRIDETCHTLLYAPTFRYDLSRKEDSIPDMKGIDIDFELLKGALEERFGGQWRIFLRLHPSIAGYSSKIYQPPYVIDATDYEDSQQLVSASDILITDYSSIMFEAAFVGKPVFLFASDREDYIGKERNLLIDYDDLPFLIAETNQKLVSKIKNFEEHSYKEKVSAFLESYGVHEDGHASERAAKFISALIDGMEV